MSNYAVVEDGMVVNVVVWDGDETIWQPPAGCEAVKIPDGVTVAIGDEYADGELAPSAPAPSAK
ncbi:TPA: hypothetical protein ACT5CR_006060 [Burkholderia cenocepacia]|uniref:hypothetical protein n=1 Tax=Burkholderia cepacia TaxID=292 RepID=UPI00075F6181|nr:hypothetical protein [Burkholderia cepacia]KVV20285.1 hypothetical protein WK78_28785 [Burkholderia cepacia]